MSSWVDTAADVLGMRGVDGVCEILWERGEYWTCVWVLVTYAKK